MNNDHPSADPFDALRGSTSIRATCRGALVIIPGEGSYRLLAENGYADRLDVNIKINPETLEWKLIGNWTPRIDGDMKAQILDHLNLFGEATVSEVAASLNFNAASVSTIMSRLTRDGVTSKRGGLGRTPARYTRSSNLLKQLETQFEHPNPDSVSDTSLLKQKTLSMTSTEKVINDLESDHTTLAKEKEAPLITFASNDHFSPTHTKLFEQSYNVDGVRDVCSNSKNESLSSLSKSQKEKSDFAIGDKVKYTGDRYMLMRICGGKKLTIVSASDGHVGVRHEDWALTQTQTIPAIDLKVCK